MFVKRGYAASLLLRLLREYDGVNGHLVLTVMRCWIWWGSAGWLFWPRPDVAGLGWTHS